MQPTSDAGARADSELGLRPTDAPGLRLLVVIPALNEAPTIASVIGAIPSQIPGVCEIDVVVVDDGSSDATAQEAERAGARVLRHSTPRGVGAAFHTALGHGIEHGADLIASIDADGQFDPADLPALIEPVVSGRADFVTGSRFVDPALVPEMPALKLWGNRVLSRLISRLAGQTLHDVSCGMRCFGRRAALGLHPMGRFTYTQEVLLNLAFQQLRLQEVPIRVRGEREFGESRVASSLWRYALRSSGIILRCYRDYFPMRFFGGLAAVLAIPGARPARLPGRALPVDRRLLALQVDRLRGRDAGRPVAGPATHGRDRRHAEPAPPLPRGAALPRARARAPARRARRCAPSRPMMLSPPGSCARPLARTGS
jgi:hypothetical protein